MSNGTEIFVCQPLTTVLKKKHGGRIHLEKSKAQKLRKAGHVKILHKLTNESNGSKKIIQATRKRMRVEGNRFTGLSIPAVVPYMPDKKIGQAYNEIMEKSESEWVLFFDHDVLLGLNPLWHDICINAINKVGDNAGWITCYTNRIGCRFQKAPNLKGFDNIRSSHDMNYHRQYAKTLYNNNKGKIKDLTLARGARFSGMFILTNKTAWSKSGGFVENGGFFNVDCKYYTSIKKAGFRVYIMQDLYVYHGYFREVLKPYFTKEKE